MYYLPIPKKGAHLKYHFFLQHAKNHSGKFENHFKLFLCNMKCETKVTVNQFRIIDMTM